VFILNPPKIFFAIQIEIQIFFKSATGIPLTGFLHLKVKVNVSQMATWSNQEFLRTCAFCHRIL